MVFFRLTLRALAEIVPPSGSCSYIIESTSGTALDRSRNMGNGKLSKLSCLKLSDEQAFGEPNLDAKLTGFRGDGFNRSDRISARAFQEMTERIVVDKKILSGKPVIRGTRIPVYLILELLAYGMTERRLMEEYPELKSSDVKAALSYASKVLRKKVIPIRA